MYETSGCITHSRHFDGNESYRRSRAPSISPNEIEKKVDYILSNAKKKLVLNHDDFLNVKGDFIYRLGLIRLDDHTQLNRLRELLPPTGGRRTRYRRKSRTRKYKK